MCKFLCLKNNKEDWILTKELSFLLEKSNIKHEICSDGNKVSISEREFEKILPKDGLKINEENFKFYRKTAESGTDLTLPISILVFSPRNRKKTEFNFEGYMFNISLCIIFEKANLPFTILDPDSKNPQFVVSEKIIS